jgi:hypothetical protein
MEVNVPNISVIIPTVGKRNVLDPTLERLRKAIGQKNIEVFVVDDSVAGTLNNADVAPFHLLKGGGKGAANARNMGWKNANAPLLLFLDDDIWITETHLNRTLDLHEEKGRKAYNFYWTYPDELMNRLNQSSFGKYILKRKLYSNEHRLDFDPKSKSGMMKMTGLTSQYFSIEKRWIEAVGGYDPIPCAGIEDLMLYSKLAAIDVVVYLSLDDIVHQYEVNKLSSDSLVSRYRTGALTRRVAVEMGHPEHGVNFTQGQRAKGAMGSRVEGILKTVEKLLPFGSVYERLINFRLFIATYRGFYSDPLPSEFSTQANQKIR